MNKLGKIFGVMLLAVVGLVVILAGFVRFYLTDERVKGLVVPPLEKVLGREVAIGDISVSLFKGISLNEFQVMELDELGGGDFISARSFVLRYDILPLLAKKVVISEVRLEEPRIRVFRDKAGKFNFESLALLEEKEPPVQEAVKKGSTTGLPIALTVDLVRIDQAKLEFEDAMGQLPGAEVTADLQVALSLGHGLADLRYQGDLRIDSLIKHGELQPRLTLSGQFDEKRFDYTLDITVEDEKLKLAGSVADYLVGPDIRLDVSSEILHVDKLLALVGGESPAAESDGQAKPAGPSSSKGEQGTHEPIGGAIPAGLVARGKLDIGQLYYEEISLSNLRAAYILKDRVVTLSELVAGLAGGSLSAKAQADLGRIEPSYSGAFGLAAVQAGQLAGFFDKAMAGNLSGALNMDMSFAGSGIEWPALAETIDGQGAFSIRNGRLKSTGLSKEIAALVKLRELNDLSFKELAGDIEIINGKTGLQIAMNSSDLQAEANGAVGLEGDLNIPLTLTLGPGLADKLHVGNSVAGYLRDDQGKTALKFKIGGTVNKPKVRLDSKALTRQAEKAVKKKAEAELGRLLEKELEKKGESASPEKEAAKGLLKGLFSK